MDEHTKEKHTTASEERWRRAFVRNGNWWWSTRQKMLAQLYVTLGGERKRGWLEHAERIWEIEFEYSAWMYEAYRRKSNKMKLPTYLQLNREKMEEYARAWPTPKLRQPIVYLSPEAVASKMKPLPSKPEHLFEDRMPRLRGKNWTDILCISLNLEMRNSELCDAVEEFIKEQRKSKGVLAKQYPGAPSKVDWEIFEHWDLSTLTGYLTGKNSVRSELTKAKKRAPERIPKLKA